MEWIKEKGWFVVCRDITNDAIETEVRLKRGDTKGLVFITNTTTTIAIQPIKTNLRKLIKKSSMPVPMKSTWCGIKRYFCWVDLAHPKSFEFIEYIANVLQGQSNV